MEIIKIQNISCSPYDIGEETCHSKTQGLKTMVYGLLQTLEKEFQVKFIIEYN